jgi:hypothetical protein
MNGPDPTDTEEIERLREQGAAIRKIESDNEGKDLLWLMGIKRGRRIMWRLLKDARVFQTSFSTNALQTAFNEGCRNYGLNVLMQINGRCPEQYFKMVQENANGGNTDDGNG